MRKTVFWPTQVVVSSTVHRDWSLFMAWVAPKRIVFLGKILLIQSLKSPIFSPQLQMSIKNKYPPLAKTL
jgi:hypothetical protein